MRADLLAHFTQHQFQSCITHGQMTMWHEEGRPVYGQNGVDLSFSPCFALLACGDTALKS